MWPITLKGSGTYSIIPPLNKPPFGDDATVAQSVEQTFRKRQVKSSNLFGGSIQKRRRSNIQCPTRDV